MVLIDEEKLVKFCRSAEQADHTDFVIKRATARDINKDQQERILEQLKELQKIYQFFNDVDIHDEDILADVFSIITRKEIEKGTKKKVVKKKKRKTKNTNKSSVVIKKMNFEKVNNSHIRFFLALI